MFGFINFLKLKLYKKIKVEECENMDIYELQKELKGSEKKIKKFKNKKFIKYSYLKFKNY